MKVWLFQKVGKNQNKFGVAKEISCRNDFVMSKIGPGTETKKQIAYRETDG